MSSLAIYFPHHLGSAAEELCLSGVGPGKGDEALAGSERVWAVWAPVEWWAPERAPVEW